MMRNSRKAGFTSLRAVLCLVAFAALGAAMPVPASADVEKARIAISTWVGYTPLYIADEKGFFEDEGLDLEITVFPGNEGQLAFAAGRVDAFTTASSSVVVLAAQGKEFDIVYVTDFSTGGDGILARDSIESVKDFKGQRIAVEEVGVSHFYLLQVLHDAGLSESDVELVNMAPDAAAAAYQGGNIDIAVTYAPYLGQVNRETKDGRIIHDTSAAPTLITDFYMFDTDFAEQHPEAVKAFIRGIVRGQEFMETNWEEALAIGAKRLEVTPESLAEDLKGIEIPSLDRNVMALADPNSEIFVVPALENLATFLKEKNQIDSVPDMNRFVNPSYLKDVSL